jgi:hypothetical protein
MAIVYGYYPNPAEKTAGVDPGPEQLCPVCGRPIGTVDALRGDIDLGMPRKFFFRLHQDCAAKADRKWVNDVVAHAIAYDNMATVKVQKDVMVN